MNLPKTVNNIAECVPECLATGRIDLSTNALTKINLVGEQPQDMIDLITMSTAEILQGPTHALLDQHFRELVVLTEHFIHVFASDSFGDLLVIVTRSSAELSAVIRQTRAALANMRNTN